jgi:hypothetical protein
MTKVNFNPMKLCFDYSFLKKKESLLCFLDVKRAGRHISHYAILDGISLAFAAKKRP